MEINCREIFSQKYENEDFRFRTILNFSQEMRQYKQKYE